MFHFKPIQLLGKKFALIPVGEYKTLDTTGIYILDNSSIIDKNKFQAVILDFDVISLSSEWSDFISECLNRGISIYDLSTILEYQQGYLNLSNLKKNTIFTLFSSYFYGYFKLVLDIFLVILSSPFTLLVILFTALAIRLESNGPIFFTQQRVGKNGKEFTIYKFRSMYIDSEKDGAKFAKLGDDRITIVGKFIRKMRIDELPQFWNILKGDMSLIGPRPEQKIFVDEFVKEIEYYNYRHLVRPGISGWAQVNQGYTSTLNETKTKLEYDLFYIKHCSFWLDCLITLKTIKTILTGFGAR